MHGALPLAGGLLDQEERMMRRFDIIEAEWNTKTRTKAQVAQVNDGLWAKLRKRTG